MGSLAIALAIVGVLVSWIAHRRRHEPSLGRLLFVFPWVAAVVLTILAAVFFDLSLWRALAALALLPWVVYLAVAGLFWGRIRKARDIRRHREEHRRQERERKREEQRAYEASIRPLIERWAWNLYELSKTSFDDLSVGEAEARRIGEEIYAEGGFPLMQRVAYRVRALGKEHGDWRAFAVQAVERWWDGIGGWRA